MWLLEIVDKHSRNMCAKFEKDWLKTKGGVGFLVPKNDI